MSRLSPLIIPAGVVDCDPVVPQRRGARRPPKAYLDVDVFLIYIIQVPKDQVAFSFVQSNNSRCHGSVDPERFPARGRVHSNERMHTLNVLWPGCEVIAVKVWVSAAVHSLLAVDDLPEIGRELFVRRIAYTGQPSISLSMETPTRSPQSVTANPWNRVVVQVGHTAVGQLSPRLSAGLSILPCWLPLVNKIGVPPGRSTSLPEAGWNLSSLQRRPDDGSTWYTRH